MEQYYTLRTLQKFFKDIPNEDDQDEFLVRKLIIERVIDDGFWDVQNRNQLELNYEDDGENPNKTFVTINRYIPGPLFMKYYQQAVESVANFRQQIKGCEETPKLMALKEDPEENGYEDFEGLSLIQQVQKVQEEEDQQSKQNNNN